MARLLDDEDDESEWGLGVYTAVAPIEDSREQALAKAASRDAAKKLWESVLKELRRVG